MCNVLYTIYVYIFYVFVRFFDICSLVCMLYFLPLGRFCLITLLSEPFHNCACFSFSSAPSVPRCVLLCAALTVWSIERSMIVDIPDGSWSENQEFKTFNVSHCFLLSGISLKEIRKRKSPLTIQAYHTPFPKEMIQGFWVSFENSVCPSFTEDSSRWSHDKIFCKYSDISILFVFLSRFTNDSRLYRLFIKWANGFLFSYISEFVFKKNQHLMWSFISESLFSLNSFQWKFVKTF